MLNPARKSFVTGSQAYRVMAGFELELAGETMAVPDITPGALDHIQLCTKKPLVGELAKAGFKLTGAEINEAWTYIRATTPVFSDGMESVAREIAMCKFLSPDVVELDKYTSPAMKHGIENEGAAVAALSEHTGIDFTCIGDNQKFLTKGNLGITPDGIEYDGFDIKSCAEVKCPEKETHFKYLYMIRSGCSLLDTESQYYWQIMTGMHVTRAKKYHWASYHDGFIDGCQLVYVAIEPNEQHMRLLEKRADRVIKRSIEMKKEIETMLKQTELD